MKLVILGSESKGNGYLLISDNECLIIESGVSFKEVKKALNFDVSLISGCISTHCHSDHMGKIKEYIKESVDCYCNDEAAISIAESRLRIFQDNTAFMVGGFKIFSFNVIHDVKTSAFIIKKDNQAILFCTDTAYIPYTFANINHFIIEANYDTDIVEKWIMSGKINGMVAKRTFNSHMSIQTCIEALKANDLKKCKNIVLIHLSSGNSNAVDFKKRVEEQTGKPCVIADKGITIEL